MILPRLGKLQPEVMNMKKRAFKHPTEVYDRRTQPPFPWPAQVTDGENPISPVYPVIDTDLGRDNVENDLTEADKQDLQ